MMPELVRTAILLAGLSHGPHDAPPPTAGGVGAVLAESWGCAGTATAGVPDGSRIGIIPTVIAGGPAGVVPMAPPVRAPAGPGTEAARPKRDAWLGADKFQHFWMSYAVTAFAFGALRAAGADGETALHAALPVAAVAGVGKEVHDRRRGEIFSLRDLVADGLGIAAAYFLLREVR
jgi:uncharacterized protein YfiM (DUF2279 family)